jgi:plastocyanin
LTRHRSGIGALTGLVVVVIIIAAAFYITIPMVGLPPTVTSISTTSTSTSGGSTTTGSGSSGTLAMNIVQPLIVAPGAKETVSMKFVAVGTVSGNYSLSATSLPNGVSVSFSPSSVDFPGQLQSAVTVTLTAASGATVVNSTISVQATAGSSVFTQKFSLMSVQALVFIQGNAFAPSSLTVAAGTKVYWLNLDASINPDIGPDTHDVTALDHSFSSGNGNLGQYDIYGHTFTTAGTVAYQSAAQPTMTGQVTVTG